MKVVLPSPQTRINAPVRPRDQPRRGPSVPNNSQAPPKTIQMATIGNQRSGSNCNRGINSSTSAGSAIRRTHQFSPLSMFSGGRANRAARNPRIRQAKSINSELMLCTERWGTDTAGSEVLRAGSGEAGAPYGNRTRVSALRGPRPGPLDEGSGAVGNYTQGQSWLKGVLRRNEAGPFRAAGSFPKQGYSVE